MENTEKYDISQLLPEVTAIVELAKPKVDVTLEPIGARCQTNTTATFAGGVAVFTATDGKNTLVYQIDTNHEKLRKGLLHVTASLDGGIPATVVTDAGPGYLTLGKKLLSATEFAATADVQQDVRFDEVSGTLQLHYTDIIQNVKNDRNYILFLKGYSLMVYVDSPSVRGPGGYSSFSSGRCEGLNHTAIHNSIYVEEISVTDVEGRFFVSAYLDKAKSNGTCFRNEAVGTEDGSIHGLTACYDLNSHEQTNPLSERFYITVSDAFLDCVYLSNGEASPYLEQLKDRIICDSWRWSEGYAEREKDLTALIRSSGMTDAILVEHRWQYATLDMANPVHYPANTTLWGTEEAFQSYIRSVKDMGWLVFLHEDYWFTQTFAQNYYYYNFRDYFPEMERAEDAIAQNADGSLRIGWQSDGKDPSYAFALQGRPYVSYATRSDMMAKYADMEGKKIQAAYDPDGSFLDVNGGVDPDWMNQLTLNADTPYGRTLAQVIADNVWMFQVIRNNYQGSVMSEGAQGERSFGSAYAGWLESGSREITDCYHCKIMPDYELKYIRPLMINQGMGPQYRFQRDCGVAGLDFDKYNAVTIAYGHTGFVGAMQKEYIQQYYEQIINVYYMFRALQPQYLASGIQVECIQYFDANGNSLVLEEALRSGYDFRTARLRIDYSGGLKLCLNFSQDNWIVRLGGKEYVLDTNGWTAINQKEDFEEYSCLVGGTRVDFARSRLYTYINTRGKTVTLNGQICCGQYVIKDGKTVVARPSESTHP